MNVLNLVFSLTLLISFHSTLILAGPVKEEEFTSRLFEISASSTHKDRLEVLAATSPRILSLEITNQESLITAKLAIQMNSPVTIAFDPETDLISRITLNSDQRPTPKVSKTFRWAPGLFSPSLLRNMGQTRNLFDSVDSYSDSDLSDNCYSRAHYWARSFDVRNRVKSMKVFVLFTPAYRSENNFNWWYHVAPYVNVEGAEGEEKIVIDPSYEQAPQALRDWVFHFASRARTCRVVTSLYEYQQTQNLGGCVVITASMFHYTPNDLDPLNPPVGWRCDDLKEVQRSLRAPAPYSDWESFTDFLPDHCW